MIETISTIGTKNSMDFRLPIKIFQADRLFSRDEFPICYSVVIVEKGIGVVEINSDKKMLVAPQILCLKPTDSIQMIHSTALQINYISFLPQIINEKFNFNNVLCENSFGPMDKLDLFLLSSFIDHQTNTICLMTDYYNEIFRLHEKLKGTLTEQEDEYWPCRSRAILFELLYKITNIYENLGTNDNFELSNGFSHDILSVISYIKNNYNQAIKIETLVTLFTYNRTSLHSDFKQTVGMSINQYITRIRLDMACLMLRDTNLPIMEIGCKVGFKSYQNFIKQFKKNLLTTPNEYRQLDSESLIVENLNHV